MRPETGQDCIHTAVCSPSGALHLLCIVWEKVGWADSVGIQTTLALGVNCDTQI